MTNAQEEIFHPPFLVSLTALPGSPFKCIGVEILPLCQPVRARVTDESLKVGTTGCLRMSWFLLRIPGSPSLAGSVLQSFAGSADPEGES